MNLPSDLVVLVADKNMEAAVQGLLGRCSALHIRSVRWKIFVHPGRDPGCLKRGHEFLRPMSKDYAHALIVFDKAGCGQENRSTNALESIVNGHLSRSGWESRAGAVVINPELEAWVWADSEEVVRCLGWGASAQELRNWVAGRGFWPDHSAKPTDPKKALELTLRKLLKRPRSSSIYRQLAQTVSFQQCMDPAFLRFKTLLQSWFSPEY
jgi:hypothetical protein